MPDDDERPRDASSAADASWTDVVVPDDISELSADIAAYHRELRHARRSAWWHRVAQRRGVLPLAVVVGACLLAGVVAALLTVMAPRSLTRAPAATPLATTNVPDGSVGGLLPSVVLQSPAGGVSTQSPTLRPAVFALLPARCDCAELVNDLAGQAFGESLPLAIVVPPQAPATTAALREGLDRGSPTVYTDPDGTLAPSVAARGVTVVLVNRDGRIYDIERGVTGTRSASLDAAVQQMLLPEARD